MWPDLGASDDATLRTNGGDVSSTILALFDEDLITLNAKQPSFTFSSGGTRIFSSWSGGYLSSGGTWTNRSDRKGKTNVQDVDPDVILEKVAAMPIQEWSYDNEAEEVRHLGPMAQDFYETFGLGYAGLVPTVDVDGVALVSIQALCRRGLE